MAVCGLCDEGEVAERERRRRQERERGGDKGRGGDQGREGVGFRLLGRILNNLLPTNFVET